VSVTLEQLQEWMESREDEHLEFKEAKNNFHFEKLVKYCAALANEGGGRIILGVTDRPPRRVVGSNVFDPLERTKAGLIERLHFRVNVHVVAHPQGRVLIFDVPPHPIGMPVQVEGAYWMRGGEDLVPMTPDMLQRLFAEGGPDYSAEICPGATVDDLDPAAINQFRGRWVKKSGNKALPKRSIPGLLADAELINRADNRAEVTYAALILLGKPRSLGRLLAQAELVFEYRSGDAPGPANQRDEYREGFLLFYDRLWDTINLRNDKQHFQDGFVMHDVPTFSEGAVREAILNAVSHRDYRHGGSVFVRQFPRRIEIVSPGGFPAGISPENILDCQFPRNRRIAEAFARCGLVDRAGQGADRMFAESIRQAKPLPDFSRSDAFQVWLTLRGEIQDPQFLRFLEKLGRERVREFHTEDLLVLDLVHRERQVPSEYQDNLWQLVEEGLIESVGRGRGARYLLSRQYYTFIGRQGVYTRKRGLDRETNKALLLKHLQDCDTAGSPLSELMQVVPSLSRRQVQRLLEVLRAEGKARSAGATSMSRWYPASSAGRA